MASQTLSELRNWSVSPEAMGQLAASSSARMSSVSLSIRRVLTPSMAAMSASTRLVLGLVLELVPEMSELVSEMVHGAVHGAVLGLAFWTVVGGLALVLSVMFGFELTVLVGVEAWAFWWGFWQGVGGVLWRAGAGLVLKSSSWGLFPL